MKIRGFLSLLMMAASATGLRMVINKDDPEEPENMHMEQTTSSSNSDHLLQQHTAVGHADVRLPPSTMGAKLPMDFPSRLARELLLQGENVEVSPTLLVASQHYDNLVIDQITANGKGGHVGNEIVDEAGNMVAGVSSQASLGPIQGYYGDDEDAVGAGVCTNCVEKDEFTSQRADTWSRL